MSESIHNCSVAYSKGVTESRLKHNKGRIGNCPYGETKLELNHWWLAGFHDGTANKVDTKMIIDYSR